MNTVSRRWHCALALAALAGCAPSFARLDGVLVDVEPDPRLAEASELGRVTVTREGSTTRATQNMALKKGDSLVTAVDGIGVMRLAAGYQIIMDPGTDITIENPSIFVRIGRIIIKKLAEVKEALTVRTEIGAAAVEGTEFVVEVPGRARMEVAVLEGRVKVYPRNARWRDTVEYVAGQAGSMDSLEIRRMPPLDQRTIRTLRRRIAEIEHTVRPIVPDVVGFSEAAARSELERHGFRVSTNPVITRQARVGTVVATSPRAGVERRVNDRVQLDVEEESVVVPSVIGQSVAVAGRILGAAGLRIGDTTVVVNADAEDGSVTGMSPSAGAFLRPGSRVSLTISRKPAAPATCQVPSLSRLTEQRARSVLEAANLAVGNVQVLESGRTVTSQSHQAGAQVPCGTKISFTIGVIG